jgi:ABC-2 type transport system permease protein
MTTARAARPVVTGPLVGLRPLLGKELREQWRTLRLPILVVVFLIIGFGSPVLARFTPELIRALGGDLFTIQLPPPTAADAVDQLLKNGTQFGILIAILLAMGTVATERDRGTAALVLVGPASRAAFIVAKAVVLALTLAVAVAAGTATAWLYTAILFEPPAAAGFAAAGVLLWLELLVFAALTFLGSTLSRSALAAAGLGFALLIVLGVLSAIPAIGSVLPTGLTGTARALAVGTPAADWRPVATSIALIVVCVAAAIAVFEREEL